MKSKILIAASVLISSLICSYSKEDDVVVNDVVVNQTDTVYLQNNVYDTIVAECENHEDSLDIEVVLSPKQETLDLLAKYHGKKLWMWDTADEGWNEQDGWIENDKIALNYMTVTVDTLNKTLSYFGEEEQSIVNTRVTRYTVLDNGDIIEVYSNGNTGIHPVDPYYSESTGDYGFRFYDHYAFLFTDYSL